MAGGDVNLFSNSSLTSGLLRRAIAADEDAWQKLVYCYGPVVHQWCRSRGLQKEDADNVGQEVFLAVAKKLADFHRQAGHSFDAWLYRITTSKIADFWRSRNREIPAEGGSDHQDRLKALASKDSADGWASGHQEILCQQMMNWIKREVEDVTWQAFHRFVILKQPAGEVATQLGLTRNAVYLAKARLLRRLRAEFSLEPSER